MIKNVESNWLRVDSKKLINTEHPTSNAQHPIPDSECVRNCYGWSSADTAAGRGKAAEDCRSPRRWRDMAAALAEPKIGQKLAFFGVCRLALARQSSA